MGRHQIYVSGLRTGYDGPRWSDPYHCEWSTVVGDRIRRLRRSKDLPIRRMCELVYKPEGGHYSGGYFSRLERGWASPPLYVYLAIADVLDVEPGRLLGPDEAEKAVTDAELTLVRFLRRIGMPPDEAIARLAGAPDQAAGSADGGAPADRGAVADGGAVADDGAL